jgi:hypothetical protein
MRFLLPVFYRFCLNHLNQAEIFLSLFQFSNINAAQIQLLNGGSGRVTQWFMSGAIENQSLLLQPLMEVIEIPSIDRAGTVVPWR